MRATRQNKLSAHYLSLFPLIDPYIYAAEGLIIVFAKENALFVKIIYVSHHYLLTKNAKFDKKK